MNDANQNDEDEDSPPEWTTFSDEDDFASLIQSLEKDEIQEFIHEPSTAYLNQDPLDEEEVEEDEPYHELKTGSQLEILINDLGHSNHELATDAAKELVELQAQGNEQAFLSLLTAATNNENSRVRRSAIWGLGITKRDEAFQPLLAILQKGIDHIPSNKTTHSGMRVLGDACNAAFALGQLGKIQAVPYLIKALKVSHNHNTNLVAHDGILRSSAALALSHLRAKEAIDPIINLLFFDSNPLVRRDAAEILSNFQGEGIDDALTQATHDPDYIVRDKADEVLRLKAYDE